MSLPFALTDIKYANGTQIARMAEIRNAYKCSLGTPQKKTSPGKLGVYEGTETASTRVDWDCIQLAPDKGR